MRALFFPYIGLLILFLCTACSKDDTTVAVTITASDFMITMDEKPSMGYKIGVLEASTNHGSLTFSLLEQNPEGAMVLDATTSSLSVADPEVFKFDLYPVITAVAKVENAGVSERITITVNLNKVFTPNIYHGTVYLNSQEEVDQFGVENYTEITGSLVIGAYLDPVYSDIHDLSPLVSVSKIEQLWISRNPELENLNGLHNISEMEKMLWIQRNESLTTIEALSNLQGEYMDVWISDNMSLQHIDGLENLEKLVSLSIGINSVLQNIQGLSGVSQTTLSVDIGRNPQLVNLEGLNNLKTIGTGITIGSNASLQNIDALSNVNHIKNNFQIINNPSLLHIDGVRQVTSWENVTMKIKNNPLLQSIQGLYHLENAAIVELINNSSLLSLEGLNNLKDISRILIEENPNIPNMDPLNNLESCTYFHLNSNNGLTDINGLSNLNYIERDFSIVNNPLLQSLDGLENLLHIKKRLYITKNPMLVNFCAFQTELLESSIEGYLVEENGYNPSRQDLIDGNCSL